MGKKELTQQPIINIDSTPDEEYVLRILQAYRENCNSKWATSTDGSCDNPMFELMNEHQDQRAKLLDEAIEKLNAYASQQMPSEDKTLWAEMTKAFDECYDTEQSMEIFGAFQCGFKKCEEYFKSLQQEKEVCPNCNMVHNITDCDGYCSGACLQGIEQPPQEGSKLTNKED